MNSRLVQMRKIVIFFDSIFFLKKSNFSFWRLFRNALILKHDNRYYINITFPERVIVEYIIPRNVIINRGAAEVDNHITRDDICDYHPLRECNIYFIIPNTTLDPFFLPFVFSWTYHDEGSSKGNV